MFEEGVLSERARTCFTHRRSVGGEALEYYAFVAEKLADVPLEWARDAQS